MLFVQLIELIFGFRIIALLPTTGVYAAVILFAVPNYFILLYRDRYKRIIRSFAPEPPELRKRRETAVWIYIYLVVALSHCPFSARLFRNGIERKGVENGQLVSLAI